MFSLYKKYFSIQVKSAMQYKTSFFLTVLGQFLTSFLSFLGIFVMFDRFHSVEGFSFSEVLLCFSVMLTEFTLAEAFARGFDLFPSMIGNGEFDRILVRPRNEIFQVLASKIELTRIGRLALAVVMFFYGVSASGVDWTPLRILTVIFMLLGGTLVFSGLFLLYAAFSFFTLEGLEFMNIFTDGAREHGAYPISIYGKRIMQFCTFVIPYTLIQYYPLLFLLGRSDSLLYVFLPLIAALFVIPCWIFWRFGVHRYKSTGS